ncbi:ABC transporter permease subunit [Longispora sp. NPDC051575]|uniref:ABC transporter permease subunit n=1 Tax=Longispora sp. NPDC051575 TaxID=3154943 RepID=UPI00343A055F
MIRAEWTKFRTVRGWVVGMVLAAVVVMMFGLFPGVQGNCGRHGTGSECVLPVGPEGGEVSDSFMFAHQPLTGDGTLTVRVADLTGVLLGDPDRAGLAPWTKAGLIVKDGTKPGSAYAAVMVTGGHGVRMQHNFAHDRAGRAGSWLRLTRAGQTVTGASSADGVTWTTVDSVRMTLPATVELGMFVASPQYAEVMASSLGSVGASGGPSRATALFDHVSRDGTWTGTPVGGPGNAEPGQRGGLLPTGDGFTVTGTGDIAPAVAGAAGIGTTVTQTLIGTFAGLILVVVVATMSVTAEYRRGLIRTTVTASPRRGRVLAAKALVLGAVTFVVGLVAAAVVVLGGQQLLRNAGTYLHPASTATELRLIVGTATLLAVSAVLGLALGVLLRRGTTAVTAAIVTIVLPYLLAMTVLPTEAARWLLRVTPAAAFAVQQSATEYAQVDNLYTPIEGYFPLAPWAGLAVLTGWTALALALAAHRLRRRDA